MRVTPREKTKAINLQLTDIPDRLYIKSGGLEIWVSTSYGQITIGVVGGKRYKLGDGELIDVDKVIGVLGETTKPD